MLTTHSHEVVRNANISQLRVIRQTGNFTCELYDFHIFQDSLKDSKPEVLEFYNFFYTVNFPDMIFADKIIMYEGDTERMFIKSILCLKEYKSLANQYISFIQVGGAYAHMYYPRIRSIFRFRHSLIISINSSRFLSCVPEIPSSAKIFTIFHLGFLLIFSV